MEYIKVSEAAKKWGISPRRVRILCSEDKIEGVIQNGKLYMIPATAEKPTDNRVKENKISHQPGGEIFQGINQKKQLISHLKQPSKNLLEEFYNNFLIDFTYNSFSLYSNSFSKNEIALILEDKVVSNKSLQEHIEIFAFIKMWSSSIDLIDSHFAESKKGPFAIKEETAQFLNNFFFINQKDDNEKSYSLALAHNNTNEPTKKESNIKDLFKLNNKRKKNLHIIERLSLFYLQFNEINPFGENTKFISRVLVNIDLISNGYLPLTFYIKDKEKYVNSFLTYSENNDSSAMIDLFCKWENSSLDQYLEYLNKNKEK